MPNRENLTNYLALVHNSLVQVFQLCEPSYYSTLPISRPNPRHGMRQCRARGGLVERPVRHPAPILAPSHLAGVEAEILAADVMVLADLGATEAGEERLRLVGASAVL